MAADDDSVEGVKTYEGPAGGWGALQAVATALKEQIQAPGNARALLQMNKPHGFDCPGCAWPDPKHTSSFEFCENGAKAVTWEATAKRASTAFFAEHTVSELWTWTDHALEGVGRLTHPMAYDKASDKFLEVSWDEAFARIGGKLAALRAQDPNSVEFYTSGRASNEAAFLYQTFVREFGTNNFPDCSNMCHEATSVGLPKSIGVGKGTVTLEDFDAADAIFCIGHNPGTNHPRMLSTLRAASKRGAPIVVFNPLRERGLERFAAPQDPVEMLTLSSTPLASAYYKVKVGGDIAVLKGMMKVLLAADAVDHDFIAEHTLGIDALVTDLETVSWDAIERSSGLSRADITAAAEIYAAAKSVIVCYGMGITQHRHGVANVQQIANLLLLRGNMGRPGAGICPLRGHSNVQGDRTVGITEIPTEAFSQAMEKAFGIVAPRPHGHNAVEALLAIRDGRSKAIVSLGGNLAVAMPDPEVVFPAMRGLEMAVHIATKPNRSHLLLAREESIILPCLCRTEIDEQAQGPQAITVEDSMSMVHASRGGLKPASEALRSEPAIVAGIAAATIPDSKLDWAWYVADYDRIRDKIAEVFPDFHDFNERVAVPGGFRLTVGASNRVWNTPSGKAHFLTYDGLKEDPRGAEGPVLTLTTVRSHDQYNTTIYGLDDRYRGVTGRRDVIFFNAHDLEAVGLAHGDVVDVETVPERPEDPVRSLRGYTAVAYEIARGSAAAYYPEANVLVGLEQYDTVSGTPSYKSVPVTVRRSVASA